MKDNHKIKPIVFFICTFLCLGFFGTIFYIDRNFVFSGNPLAQILFHVLVQIDGANPVFIRGILLQCIILPFICALCVTIILFGNFKFLIKFQKTKFIEFVKKISLYVSICLLLVSGYLLANTLKLKEYIETYTVTTTLYEDEYVDPSKVEYTFPKTKRNLIYIFLESIETSEYSKAQGGFFDKCLIPELYQLAQDNVTFNDNQGFDVAPNTGWTIAAMIGQSAGIPLDMPIGENDFVTDYQFIEGAYSIGDLLEDNGYHNELLIGSDAVFGGREYYYKLHGDYDICDLKYAEEIGLMSKDDEIWWGYLDKDLFAYAKNDLLRLANEDQPFNLTMLTVDTHHNDGFVCDLCENEFGDDLANVYACSSRQVTAFIEWCKQQDFYENTTIVLAGDHTSMDANYGQILNGFNRKVYYTIINSAENCVATSNRTLCTFDLYPTTVAALGIEFKENRLGLGTNLFSNEQTLCEKYGMQEFYHLVDKNSTYYNNHILYGLD